KIGDLFVALGFQVEGEEKVEKVDVSVKQLAASAFKLTAVVDAVNVAMIAMVNSAMKAAVGLRSFALQTGLSTDDLQRWQHTAQVNSVTADQLTDTIKGLADAKAQFAMGNPQAVGAWQMLGINPVQDPFKVLDALRDRFQKIKDPNIARALAGQVGISDNVFTMLRAGNTEFEQWNRNLAITQDEQAKLINLNKAWQDILFSVTALRNRFAVELVPVFRLIAEGLRVVLDLGGRFISWLHEGSGAANMVKVGILVTAAALLVLGVALTFVTTVLAAFAAVMFIADIASWPVVVVVAAIAAAIVYLIAIITPSILLMQDWWTAFEGGKSYFNWEKSIKIVNTLLNLMKELAKATKDVFSAGQNDFLEFFQKHAWLTTFGLSDPNNPNLPGFSKNVPHAGGYGQVRQENNTTIHIDGAHDPKTTGREVSRSLKDVHAAASRQMPAVSY
ncbi:MAG TPA: hypothetical protein VJU82_03525, partial [Acidobacteriaceae bacterium]|nr:hypothetical protein [Acidobacteriaceae bacterium]